MTTGTSTGKMITMMAHETPGALSYPRTGKRGVPQQFPRRLYTMLQSESSCPDDISNHNPLPLPLIQWSHSGQAFRIIDIDQFSTHVLPKYFRTSKFSSFQRNLNLVSDIKYILDGLSLEQAAPAQLVLLFPTQREAIAISYFLVCLFFRFCLVCC